MPSWLDTAGEWLEQALPYVVGGIVLLLLLSWLDRHRPDAHGGPGGKSGPSGGEGDDAGR